jgi:hypothetical protein
MASRRYQKKRTTEDNFPRRQSFSHHRFLFKQSTSSERWQIFGKLAIATHFMAAKLMTVPLLREPFFPSLPSRHDDINKKF